MKLLALDSHADLYKLQWDMACPCGNEKGNKTKGGEMSECNLQGWRDTINVSID